MPLQGYGHRFGPNFSRIDTRLEDALPRLDEPVVTLEDEENDVALTERVEALEAAIAALQASQVAQDTLISLNSADVDVLQVTDTSLDTRVDALESTDTSHDTRLDTAESDIDSLEDDVAALAAGAPPDPATDILIATTQAELQSYIDDDKTNAKQIKVRQGPLSITSQTDIDFGYGGDLEGYGMMMPAQSSQTRERSYIEYTGPKGGDNICFNFTRALSGIRKFSVFGNTRGNCNTGSATLGDIAIQIQKDAFTGTGKLCLEMMGFSHWDRVLRWGTGPNQGNCDSSNFNYLRANKCRVFHQQLMRQCLGYLYLQPELAYVDQCFELIGGGDLHVIGGNMLGAYTTDGNGDPVDSALFRFRNDEPGEFGQNAGEVTSDDMKWDQAAFGQAMVRCDEVAGSQYNARVSLERPQVPYVEDINGPRWGATNTLIDVSGRFRTRVIGGIGLYPNSIRWNVGAGVICEVIVREHETYCLTNLYTEALDTANSSGTLYLTFQGNKYGSGFMTECYQQAIVGDLP